jgi:hypothetical protein
MENANGAAKTGNNVSVRCVIGVFIRSKKPVSDTTKGNLGDSICELKRRPASLPTLITGKRYNMARVNDEYPQLVNIQSTRIVSVPSANLQIQTAIGEPRLVLAEDLVMLAVRSIF